MKGYSIVSGWSSGMQSLVVQALAMRQLGRLNAHRVLAAGYGLQQVDWCPRSIHTRQLWGCSAFPALGCRDAVRSSPVHHLRFKSSKKKDASRATKQQEEEEEEEDDEGTEASEDEDVDPNLTKDYKDMEKYVQSFRYDVILKAGLDVTRNQIEDAFYQNNLRLNGQKLIKKSKTVKVGDTLDWMLSENQETNSVSLMRVVLRRVFSETSNKERYKVALRRWKVLELPKDEAFKS